MATGEFCATRATAAPGNRILVSAPIGRDAALLVQLLTEGGLEAVDCGMVDRLEIPELEGAGALLITAEALGSTSIESLERALRAQPSWSDLPVILLGDIGWSSLDTEIASIRAVAPLNFIERPTHALTLLTAIDAALRARRRQYQLRDLIRKEAIARERAEDATRVKDEFLATVSHELRTPLSAILLWANLLAKGRLDEHSRAQGLDVLTRSARMQSKLIEDLLDMSRMISGKIRLDIREVDVDGLLRSAVEVVRPTAGAKDITLEVDSEYGTIASLDPDRMQQVLWNLLSNAVKFTGRRGRVSIRHWCDQDGLRIEVADTGKGIDREFLPHVFERFRQADVSTQRLHGGLGLGLAISRHIVELQGGSIFADSPGLGQGSKFVIILPIISTQRALPNWKNRAEFALGSPPPPQRLRGVRVILVEDDASTRTAIALALGQEGAEVISLETSASALEILSALPGERGRHVLLTDLSLPDFDGIELLARVRASEHAREVPSVPAAVLTAHQTGDHGASLLAAGFAAYLPKPIELERIIAVVESLTREARDI